MERLLDPSQPVDVALLESTVRSLHTATNPADRKQANEVLTRLKESPNAWESAGTVLEASQDVHTRFFALQMLEDAINYRWLALPKDQRETIRNYIVKKIIDLTSVDGYTNDHGQKLFVSKLNVILVQILKQEWPHNWPNFIEEIVGSSQRSEVLCENNMHVFKLLSEEIFDFSKEDMVSEKATKLKQQFNDDFSKIFELCQLVLTSSQRPSLIAITLETLLRFINWIPLGYIFETPLVEQLLTKYFPNQQFRNSALACLTEIVSVVDPKYNHVFQAIYNGVLNILQTQLPIETNIAEAYSQASDRDCTFIRGLSLFFTSFFNSHIAILEQNESHNVILSGMFYLVSISTVDDSEIFNVCLEFWNLFAKDLYDSARSSSGGFNMAPLLNMGGPSSYGNNASMASQRRQIYDSALTRVRSVMISRMAKPEEVLVVEGDDGTIIRETTKDTDAIAQYKLMRDTLVYLTNLDCEDTEKIMLTKLTEQSDSKYNMFNWNTLNTLCWAIGSISGAMGEEDEKKFLIRVIRDLLSLVEEKSGKDNKAVVASNIMYVVGQYPRFLRAHWKFLKTVVKKLFEFMHETHPGVQDMACDTFLKISQKCKAQFVVLHPTDTRPFIEELLEEMPHTMRDLMPHQRHTFYEAAGYMVREQPNENARSQLLERLMQTVNGQWQEIMQLGAQNTEALVEITTIQKAADILRVNVRVCTAMGNSFRPQIMKIYLDMLNLYKFYSSRVSQSVEQHGEIITQHMEAKVMRLVKNETLKLIETFASKTSNTSDLANNFCPRLVEPVLNDYQVSVPTARAPEVLELFTVIVNKLKGEVATTADGKLVEAILSPLFHSTLGMITENFTDFPEHRINFYRLLKAFILHAFGRLFPGPNEEVIVPPETQKNIVDAVVWAMKHEHRQFAELGLEIMENLLSNVASASGDVARRFYSAYYLSILQDVLAVLTDRLHKSSFTMQTVILKHLFLVVAVGKVQVPLEGGFDINENLTNERAMQICEQNKKFLHQYTANMIANAFPNVARTNVETFVSNLFDINANKAVFKTLVRDFLITIKEFTPDEVLAQDREEKLLAEQQQRLAARAQVPGMLTDQEREEMAEL